MDLPDNYGWVLFMELLILVEYYCTVIYVGYARKKVFTPKFMSENFGEEFRNTFRRDPDPLGYPDMGNGRFSEKLSFADWYYFNNAQRVHYNFLEGIHIPLVCIPIGGVELEYYTIGLAAAYIAGRAIYAIGYTRVGSKGRLIGVGILDLALIGLVVIAFISSIFMVYN
ncbi:unnamed protein product [Blepharisma stoltei]|uniref:MAPEG family protein n=1 Tax=Blepharisma stoltei TaxID=1481888 RepID=A0AAU9IEA1_9CILI|nr:unnamed protein product [Blepharisma stoltei]